MIDSISAIQASGADVPNSSSSLPARVGAGLRGSVPQHSGVRGFAGCTFRIFHRMFYLLTVLEAS
jgi:hypothetical protein